MKLDKEYYKKSARGLAPDLLGKLICVKREGISSSGSPLTERYRITETECYYGEEDTACHAHKGRTARTGVMYRGGGVLYVYLCYGIHYLMNIVTGPENHPEAVLIRGIEGAKGPGKTTNIIGIDKTYNGIDLCSDIIWLEDDGAKPEYIADRRVGIGYASKEDRERLWRYIMI